MVMMPVVVMAAPKAAAAMEGAERAAMMEVAVAFALELVAAVQKEALVACWVAVGRPVHPGQPRAEVAAEVVALVDKELAATEASVALAAAAWATALAVGLAGQAAEVVTEAEIAPLVLVAAV